MLTKKVSKTAQAGSFSARYTPGLLWTRGSAAAGACTLPGSGKGWAAVIVAVIYSVVVSRRESQTIA
jgi:hypothetical protein